MRPWTLALALAAGCHGPGTDEPSKTDEPTDLPTDVTDLTDTDVDPDGLDEAGFREAFVTRAVALWPGTDFTYGGDGTDGIDGAGTVWVTLNDLGYGVSRAPAYDLAANTGFPWVVPGDATHEQLSGGDHSQLQRSDLILLDYDFDELWDHIAIALGDGKALTASDYFDEVVIADLSDYNDPFSQDLTWSHTGSARLDYPSIETTWSAP